MNGIKLSHFVYFIDDSCDTGLHEFVTEGFLKNPFMLIEVQFVALRSVRVFKEKLESAFILGH